MADAEQALRASSSAEQEHQVGSREAGRQGQEAAMGPLRSLVVSLYASRD